MSVINVTRSSMPPFEEYCDEIRELWDSHWLTDMGVKHKQLQAQLEEYLDIKEQVQQLQLVLIVVKFMDMVQLVKR